MRLTSTLAIVALAVMPAVATAQAPAAAPAAPAAAKPAYSTSASTIGQLMDNAAAKDIVLKYAPDLAQAAGNPQAAGITIKDIQGYIPSLSDDVLAKMDAELAKLPAPK